MPSSILLHSRKSNVFGLAITITTCSLVVSQPASNQSNVITKNCGEDVSLYCNIDFENPRRSESYWYRLPPEKIAKIQNLPPDEIAQYAVPTRYYPLRDWNVIIMGDSKTFNITIPYLSLYDAGLYTCLDQSETERVKIISSLWLNIICKERLLTKTSYSAAPPYIFMRHIVAYHDATNSFLHITNIFRGYPKPDYFACTENNQDITHECEEQASFSYLSLSKPIQEKDVTITLSICNINGCFNDTLRFIYEKENQTLVLQEPRGHAMMMCIHISDEKALRSGYKWAIKNRKETNSAANVLMLGNTFACHIIRQKGFLDEGTYELKTEEPLEGMTTYRLKIQNDNRNMNFIPEATLITYLF